MYLQISDIALCTSCNMDVRDLLDMYTQSLRAEGIHIRQGMNTHILSKVCTPVLLLAFYKSAQTYSSLLCVFV